MKFNIKGSVLFAAMGLSYALALPAYGQGAAQVYGVLDLWAGGSKTSGAGPSVTSVNNGGMQSSFWGVGGSEDLGGGMRSIYAVEGYLQLDTGAAGRSATDAMFARNAYVGLTGPCGEFKLGRLLNPLFVSTALTNPFGGSIRFAPLLAQIWSVPMGRAVSGDTSWDNTIAYTTPALNGFKLSSYLGLGETAIGTGTRNANATLSYSAGALYLTATAQQVKVGPGLAKIGSSEQRTYYAGATYDMKMLKLYGSYASADSDQPDRKARTSQIGVSLPGGLGSFLLSWAQTKIEAPGTADARRDTGAFGYDYYVSKRTDLYAVAQYDKLKSANGASSFGVGIRHKF
jgi:predicted porin